MRPLLKIVLTLAVVLGCLPAGSAVAQDNQLRPHKTPAQPGFPQPGDIVFPQADLIVPEFRATGAASYGRDGYFSLPVRFTVTNQGQRSAAAFKLALYMYDNRPPARLVKFTTATPGQKPGWYAWSPPLDPGDRQTFVGRVSVPKMLAGTTIRLYVHADSTAGEELARKNGQVGETSEKNNYSASIRVRLPRLLGKGSGMVAR